MIIKVSNDIKRLDVYANGVELASIMGKDRKDNKRMVTYPSTKKMFVTSIKNPVLMTDVSQIAKFKQEMRDTLFALYSSKPRIVEYDGISVWWDDARHINVWCPSIDTILYAKGLKKVFEKRKNFKNAIEIGCGSGFLAKYALAKLPKLKQMTLVDINKYAILCAKDNIRDKRAKFVVGNGLKFIRKKKYDLIICNPPYIPRPDVIEKNPYEGVSLLHHLLHEGDKYLNKGGIIVTNISSLAEGIVLKEKPKMKFSLLEKMEVPLKVNNIMNNQRWLNYLKKRGLKSKSKRGYRYWQTINIVKLEK